MTALSKPKLLKRPKLISALKSGVWDYGLAALAALAAGALFWSHARISALEAELASRPKIAVADYSKLTTALTAGVSPQNMKPVFDSLKARAAAHAEAGWLVINRASLEAAPDELIISPGEAASRQLDEAITAALNEGEGLEFSPPPASGAAAPANEAGAILKSLIRGE